MITKHNWPEDWAKVPEWTEISEEIYEYFFNALPPMNKVGTYFQFREAFNHEEEVPGCWRGRYMTFVKKDGKCWFIGIQFSGRYPIRKVIIDSRMREYLFDHGVQISGDGFLRIPQDRAEKMNIGKSLRKPECRTLTVPSVFGLTVLYEGQHWAIVKA